ncbi:hypothetical protein TCON_1538 [Astathelohania contejeani]|uniref:Uncharacterized protein n=1 Tax=Astathelohania contejeani TaxID=164912 RepID=A0ABQ7HYI6_9MICR|nr:hypothetical protein TCON_1538 [Thelohania contejeani]
MLFLFISLICLTKESIQQNLSLSKTIDESNKNLNPTKAIDYINNLVETIPNDSEIDKNLRYFICSLNHCISVSSANISDETKAIFIKLITNFIKDLTSELDLISKINENIKKSDIVINYLYHNLSLDETEIIYEYSIFILENITSMIEIYNNIIHSLNNLIPELKEANTITELKHFIPLNDINKVESRSKNLWENIKNMVQTIKNLTIRWNSTPIYEIIESYINLNFEAWNDMKNNYNIYFLLKKNLLECEKRLEIIKKHDQNYLKNGIIFVRTKENVINFIKNLKRLRALKQKFIFPPFPIGDQSALELEFFQYIKKEYNKLLAYLSHFLKHDIQNAFN